MTASFAPINITYGSQVVDKSVVPIIKTTPVVIRSYNMRPGALVNFWFDDYNINGFVQPISFLTCNIGFAANTLNIQEPIYCVNTHAYAVVQENSQGTILHISENFTCVNVTKFASSDTWTATQYLPDDIVYQANNIANVYANTMFGRVAYWDSANGALALTVEGGSIANAAGNLVLFKVGSSVKVNVANTVMGNKFPVGATIVSTANNSKNFLAAAYQSNHGLIGLANSGSIIQLSGNVVSGMVGRLLYAVRGTGIGQTGLITAVDTVNARVTINTSWTQVNGNTYYGVGNVTIDGIGIGTGIFQIPEDPNLFFQTGSRLITVNDGVSYNDNSATTRSTSTLAAVGATGTTGTPVIKPSPPLSPAANSTVAPSPPTSSSINNNGPVNLPQASADPLVQTFFTPKSNIGGADYGCFATSVNLFFQNKPAGSSTQFPVTIYIVDTVNGFPTSNVIATSTVRYEDIKITNGNTSFPDSANSSTYTKFSFRDPVYLAPGTEYGIAVYSESPDYQIWISQLGQNIINSTRLVSQSPYVGSFFIAQNASAWNPIQNQTLMFVLNKAAFTTNNPTSLTFAVRPPPANVYMDIATVHSEDLSFPAANITYGIKATTANSGVFDAAFKQVNVDKPFYYGGDLVNSSINSNRRRLIQEGNANSTLVQVTLSSTNPDVSPFFHSEALHLKSFGNIINNGGIPPSSISITAGGNHLNAANIVVTFTAPTGDGGITATANIKSLTGNAVTALNITNPGAGYQKAPTITITEAGAPVNAIAIVSGEDGTSGGNDLARYVTRPITLADGFDSGDLQVFLQAIRPQGTDIGVYYKVLSSADTDPISAKSWQLMNKVNDIFSIDQNTPINLSYNTGLNALGVPNGSVAYVQNGITYPIGGKFKTFMIKIVLTANDPTVPPEVQNMRAIAVPAG